MHRRLTLALALAALGGCSPASDSDFDDREAAVPESDNGADTDGDEDGSDDAVTYWSLDGDLVMAQGELDLELSALTVMAHDASGAPLEDAAPCTLLIDQALEGPPRGDQAPPLVAWWTLTLVDAGEQPCGWTIPRAEALLDQELDAIALGIGDVSPVLSGPMAAAGLDPDLQVYGLTALIPTGRGDSEAAFGLTGTAAQFAGVEGRVSSPPLPDGAYSLRTLVLLPL